MLFHNNKAFLLLFVIYNNKNLFKYTVHVIKYLKQIDAIKKHKTIIILIFFDDYHNIK
jgi:hypothetical protein